MGVCNNNECHLFFFLSNVERSRFLSIPTTADLYEWLLTICPTNSLTFFRLSFCSYKTLWIAFYSIQPLMSTWRPICVFVCLFACLFTFMASSCLFNVVIISIFVHYHVLTLGSLLILGWREGRPSIARSY